MAKYIIKGGKKLSGTVRVSGSKNAALPILCAALLTNEPVTIKNVPDIADIYSLLKILNFLGCKTNFENNTVNIDSKNLTNRSIPTRLVCDMRASILLLGPLVARFGKVKMGFPGGCILGKRPVQAHSSAFRDLGCTVKESNVTIQLETKGLRGNKIIMSELSVTATENAVMAAATAKGTTKIHLAAAEPHVQDLCEFLNTLGAKISGIGSHDLTIEGIQKLHGGTYSVTGDYLEAGTFAIASVLTKGDIKIDGINPNHLYSFWQKLRETGADFELSDNYVQMKPHSRQLKCIPNLKTAVHPSFPTDLQAPFAVLLTKSRGVTKIHETLFEGRLNYLFELEKMGAKFEILNPHQAIIIGPSKLKAGPISSWDIRAGAAMVLAALAAKGQTEISNIRYIDRGYENLEFKLKNLGASIERAE